MRIRRALALAALLASVVAVPGAGNACSWPLVFEADTFNVAYPDENATYWLTQFVGLPGSRIRIDGVYPDARYFSFHAYDPLQRPVGSLADREIAPAAGSLNPFVTPGATPGGSYTAYVEFTPPPDDPAPNTLYAGETNEGTPNPAGTIIYRVYVPDDASDRAGGVALPELTLETANGAIALPLGTCEPLPPSSGGQVSTLIRESSFPNAVPRVVPWPPAQDPPEFVKFYSLATNLIDRLPSNPATDAIPRDTSGGFLSNRHINYLFALTSRSLGDVFAMRARAPVAPDTRAGAHLTDPADLRYWSVCENDFLTQRFIACLADFQVQVDGDGFFTIAVSDPDDRPASAVNWLPWGGPFYEGNVIYRHMLPAAGFAGAIQNVAYGESPRDVMGDYFPEAAYCSTAEFEAGTCFD
jgi:hypothetical protein